MEQMGKIRFTQEGEEQAVEFYILEEAKLAGHHYVLVTDSEDGDGECLILRAEAGEQEISTYEAVEDERELSAVLVLMRDTLEELGIDVVE